MVIPPQTLIYTYIIQVAIASVPIIYSRITHRHLRNYGFKITKKLLIQGVSLSIGIGIGLSFISSPHPLTIGWIFLSCFLAPIGEEFFFRGFVQTHLMEKLKGGKRLLKFYLSYGLMLTALIFGMIHLLNIFVLDLSLVNAIIRAMFAMLFGLLIGYIYQETRSLLGPILMHGCLNGLTNLLPYYI